MIVLEVDTGPDLVLDVDTGPDFVLEIDPDDLPPVASAVEAAWQGLEPTFQGEDVTW